MFLTYAGSKYRAMIKITLAPPHNILYRFDSTDKATIGIQLICITMHYYTLHPWCAVYVHYCMLGDTMHFVALTDSPPILSWLRAMFPYTFSRRNKSYAFSRQCRLKMEKYTASFTVASDLNIVKWCIETYFTTYFCYCNIQKNSEYTEYTFWIDFLCINLQDKRINDDKHLLLLSQLVLASVSQHSLIKRTLRQ